MYETVSTSVLACTDASMKLKTLLASGQTCTNTHTHVHTPTHIQPPPPPPPHHHPTQHPTLSLTHTHTHQHTPIQTLLERETRVGSECLTLTGHITTLDSHTSTSRTPSLPLPSVLLCLHTDSYITVMGLWLSHTQRGAHTHTHTHTHKNTHKDGFKMI